MSSRVKNRLVVLGAVVLAMGGIAYSIVVSAGAFRRIFREPRPTQMTCDQFLARRPAAEWLRLTQCRIDATSPVYKRRGTTIENGCGRSWTWKESSRPTTPANGP